MFERYVADWRLADEGDEKKTLSWLRGKIDPHTQLDREDRNQEVLSKATCAGAIAAGAPAAPGEEESRKGSKKKGKGKGKDSKKKISPKGRGKGPGAGSGTATPKGS